MGSRKKAPKRRLLKKTSTPDSSHHTVNLRRLMPDEYASSRQLNITEISYDLMEEYMDFAPGLDQWGDLDPHRIAEVLVRMFTPEEIGYLIHFPTGRGTLLGAVMSVVAIENSILSQLDDRFPEDGDEDPEDGDLEDIVAQNVFGYRTPFGGTEEDGETN